MTIVGKPFSLWVKQRVDARHRKVAEDAKMHIDMDPEINAVYLNSKAVSGKWLLLSLLDIFDFSSFLSGHSQQGQLLQPAQGVGQAQKGQGGDQRGQGT